MPSTSHSKNVYFLFFNRLYPFPRFPVFSVSLLLYAGSSQFQGIFGWNLILKLLNFWSEAPYKYIFGRTEYAVFAELHISEISAICLGHTPEYAVFVGVSHIGDIGDMFGTYGIYICSTVFVGVSHIGDIGDMFGTEYAVLYLWEY